MDYEKKYKEALERAKQFSETPYLEDSKGIVEYIFPELAESKDEEIRKELIAAFQNGVTYNQISKAKAKDYIAWLEKQGEQKPWSEEDEDMCYKATAVINRLCAEGKEYVWSVNTLKTLFYWLKSLKYRVGCEANCTTTKEWSEEDERDFDIIYGIIYNSCIAEDASRLIAWLKSLKDRYTWKPSEEQLDSLYDVLNPYDGFNREVLESLYVQLKKLREE